MDLQYLFIIIAIILLLSIVAYYLIFNKKEEPKKATEKIVKEKIIINEKKELHDVPEVASIQAEVEINKNVINKVNEEINTVIEDNLEEKPKIKVNISSKTEKTLLKKLANFEESKAFIKKDVNLNKLAKDFDTNTKYLSEIIKTYKNKNFNQYLNELRINHLIEELNTNQKVLNTKVSYLANDFGFNSHSSFSTLFVQIVGQSPSEYIKNLKDKKKQEQL